MKSRSRGIVLLMGAAEVARRHPDPPQDRALLQAQAAAVTPVTSTAPSLTITPRRRRG